MTRTHFLPYLYLLTIAISCLWFFAPTLVLAATLGVSPNTGVYQSGATFTARVVVNTEGKPINAAEGTLSFSPSELAVVSISKGTIFNLWAVEPSFSNTAGTITFGGGSTSGYTGSAGTIISVTFRSKAAGAAKVSFKNGSVLAADGLGTNVLRSMGGGTYTLQTAAATPEPEIIEYIAPANTPAAPKVQSSSHADSVAWHKVKTASLTWTLPSDVTAVRTALDKNPTSIPTKVYDSPISQITLADLEEGVQYFHLQFRNSEGWGRVTHYRLAIDSEKPSSFDIQLAPESDLSNPQQVLSLKALDATSKVKRYMVQIDGGTPYEYLDETGSSTILLPSLPPGQHTLAIEAFDEAGNSIVATFAFSILAFNKPQFTEYPSSLRDAVIPVIKGITKPNSKVTITMTQLGVTESSQDAIKTYEVQSGENGEFVVIPDGRLAIGVYELVAVAIDQSGAQSEPSDAIRIVVEVPGIIAYGEYAVQILSVLVPLIGLVALLVFLFLHSRARFKKVRSYVIAETDEALVVLDREFGSLLDVLSTEEALLASQRKSHKLTKAEVELFVTLRKQVTNAKLAITKEISDVDDLVT